MVWQTRVLGFWFLGFKHPKPQSPITVVYSAACAACLAGQAAEAGQLLIQVMMCGGCTAEGIAADEDLRGLPPLALGGGVA
jgi:hypothetical protein